MTRSPSERAANGLSVRADHLAKSAMRRCVSAGHINHDQARCLYDYIARLERIEAAAVEVANQQQTPCVTDPACGDCKRCRLRAALSEKGGT